MVKCLRQGGWRGGRRGQARRVGMVRRLLQCLDQVVSVLWIYGPEGTFAYALKETEEEERGKDERERCYWKCYQVPQSTLQTRRRNSQTQSSKFRPDLYTQARVLLGDNAWRNENHHISFAISLHISLPSLQKKKKKKRKAFSD